LWRRLKLRGGGSAVVVVVDDDGDVEDTDDEDDDDFSLSSVLFSTIKFQINGSTFL
jgi:hypothetical protein